jgi:TatA/E family protein of Tat protein translocase
MADIGPWEVLLVLVVALVLFGPSKLPEIGRSAGKTMREFQRSLRGDTD